MKVSRMKALLFFFVWIITNRSKSPFCSVLFHRVSVWITLENHFDCHSY